MRSFVGDTSRQYWLWWAIDHHTGEPLVFHFGTREHENLDKLLSLLRPFAINIIYTEHKYAYRPHDTESEVVTGKEKTQKIERKHRLLRTWCSRLVRKDIYFSQEQCMHKIVIAVVITFWFFQRIIW